MSIGDVNKVYNKKSFKVAFQKDKMFGEGEFNSKSPNQNAPFIGFITLKVIRVASIFIIFEHLRILNYPTVFWAFLTLLFTAIIFLVYNKPWQGRLPDTKQIIQILIYGVLQLLQLVFYFFGVKYFGVVRSIIFSGCTETTYVYISGLFFEKTRNKMHNNRKRGIILLLIGYNILFWFDKMETPIGLHSSLAADFSIGIISISASKVGAISLIISSIFEILRKNTKRSLSHEIGGAKRLDYLSTIAAALLISPFGLISWFTANIIEGGGNFYLFEGIFATVSIFMIANFVADNLLKPSINSPHLNLYTLIISLFFAFILEIFVFSITFSYLTFISAFFIFFGQYLLFESAEETLNSNPNSNSILGNLSSGEENFSTIVYNVSNQLFAIIKLNKDARNISIYLSINLLFMFVEFAYGVWNNSLGLISDACHMLFDCVALLIGLIALVIVEWSPNRTFTYGYGRVNVLSGFINGVFLIFIGCSVLFEAVQRFFEPPEIENDKLLLVSFLGLCVNLVGLSVFSQAHHAAHGHSHAHSHDKKKEISGKFQNLEEEESLQGEHGHSHGGDHDHDHHGHSHGDHAHGGDVGAADDDHEDENLKGVFLHILGDTLGSVGVITSSILIEFFNWTIADPICSFIISIFIFIAVIPLLKSSAAVLLQKTPTKFEKKLRSHLLDQVRSVQGVRSYSDVHFWSPDANSVVGTIHIQVYEGTNTQKILSTISQLFKENGVQNVTIQIEELAESSTW